MVVYVSVRLQFYLHRPGLFFFSFLFLQNALLVRCKSSNFVRLTASVKDVAACASDCKCGLEGGVIVARLLKDTSLLL